MALQSSPEQPLPVRTIARAIGEYIARLGRVWIEGQVTQVSRRPGASVVFLTLRDPSVEMSLSVTCSAAVYAQVAETLRDGSRVVVWAKPDFYLARGTLSLTAYEIRPVGVGELLARLERLKGVLAAEGLFDRDRKKPLPFLPRRVGLITGRASAAERDVVENARRRWPAVDFEIREVAVQGPGAVTAVIAALAELDALPEVDVIVLARGGGSLEDLLPFSDEALCRAVSATRTPTVSAIGHEPDSPLVDYVADVRCSTPTDAGKRVVPDVTEEAARITRDRDALHRHVWMKLDREQAWLDGVRSRPSLASPEGLLDKHSGEVAALVERLTGALSQRIEAASAELTQMTGRVRALSPLATLQRGYAVLQGPDGHVVTSTAAVSVGDAVTVRVADGRVAATVTSAG